MVDTMYNASDLPDDVLMAVPQRCLWCGRDRLMRCDTMLTDTGIGMILI